VAPPRRKGRIAMKNRIMGLLFAILPAARRRSFVGSLEFRLSFGRRKKKKKNIADGKFD